MTQGIIYKEIPIIIFKQENEKLEMYLLRFCT